MAMVTLNDDSMSLLSNINDPCLLALPQNQASMLLLIPFMHQLNAGNECPTSKNVYAQQPARYIVNAGHLCHKISTFTSTDYDVIPPTDLRKIIMKRCCQKNLHYNTQ